MRKLTSVCAVLGLVGTVPMAQGVDLISVPFNAQIDIGSGPAIYIATGLNGNLTFRSDEAEGYCRNSFVSGWYYGPYVDFRKTSAGQLNISGCWTALEVQCRYFQGAGNTNPYGDAPIFLRMYTDDPVDPANLGYRDYSIFYATQAPWSDPPHPTWTFKMIMLNNLSATAYTEGYGGNGTTLFDPTKVTRMRFYGTDWDGQGGDFMDVKKMVIYNDKRVRPNIVSDDAYPNILYQRKFFTNLCVPPAPTWSKVLGPAALTVDAATGLVQWTPTEQDLEESPYTVQIKADIGTENATEQFLISVKQEAPVIQDPPNHTTVAGHVYERQLILTKGSPPITWIVQSGVPSIPPNMTITSGGKVTGWVPLADNHGQTWTITVKATNFFGNDTSTWNVTVQNEPPIIQQPADDTTYATQEYVRQLTLQQGAPVITWTLVSGPAGMAITPNGVVYGWTPAAAGGPYAITVRASNRGGLDFDTKSWNVTVAALPPGADLNVAPPWGTIHANISGTQASNHASLIMSKHWANGAQLDWALDVKGLGLDRPSARGGMSFDEAGNIYWKTQAGFLASVTPTGTLRWTGNQGGSPKDLGDGDNTTPVVGDGGPSGRVYVLSNSGAAAFSKSTGELVWERALPDTKFAGQGNRLTPVLYNGNLYVVGTGVSTKEVYQVDAVGGAIEWHSTVSGFDVDAGVQMTLVPDALGTGVHGLYYNADGGIGGAGMFCIAVSPSGASLGWKSTSGKVAGRSHVVYMNSPQRVFAHTWGDYGAKLYGWDLGGTNKSVSNNVADTAHGYYDQGCVDFNGKDLIAGGFQGQIVRYLDISAAAPSCEPPMPPNPILYNSNGFESPTFNLGDLSGQNGWVSEIDGAGAAPAIVDFGGSRAVKLEVPDSSGAGSRMTLPVADLIAAGHRVITVSYDIYRVSNVWPSNLWWWWFDTGEPTFGGQWDVGLGGGDTCPTGPATPGTMPFAWSPTFATVMDRWANTTQTWNLDAVMATATYDGSPAAVGITGITTLTGWAISLQHDECNGSGPEVAYIDNFFITVCDEGGSSGGPTSNGYYQLTNDFGEFRAYGGLYQDEKGKSIFLSGTNNVNTVPSARIVAHNITDNVMYTVPPDPIAAPPQTPLFEYDTGIMEQQNSFTVVGGPQLGPVTAAYPDVPQHVYYFEGSATARLIALKAIPTFLPDCDKDRKDVDEDDYDIFLACTTGPNLGPPPPNCECADLEPVGAPDGDVDSFDFGMFQACISGKDLPYNVDCYP